MHIEEGMWYTGTGVTVSCEPPRSGSWEPNSGSLEEQQELLILINHLSWPLSSKELNTEYVDMFWEIFLREVTHEAGT